jgi:hypothetical protein
LQEQRTPIACTVMGIEFLGSKVEFLLVLFTPPILLLVQLELQCSNRAQNFICIKKLKRNMIIVIREIPVNDFNITLKNVISQSMKIQDIQAIQQLL